MSDLEVNVGEGREAAEHARADMLAYARLKCERSQGVRAELSGMFAGLVQVFWEQRPEGFTAEEAMDGLRRMTDCYLLQAVLAPEVLGVKDRG